MEKKITRYYEAYMKFSRKCLEGFAEHDELNIDIENASKEDLAMALACDKYDSEDHYAK